MFKSAGINQINIDNEAKKNKNQPVHTRAERVTSQERDQRWAHDKIESKIHEKESDQNKWFHDKFNFEDDREESKSNLS